MVDCVKTSGLQSWCFAFTCAQTQPNEAAPARIGYLDIRGLRNHPRIGRLCWVRPRSGGATKTEGLPEVFVKATDQGLTQTQPDNKGIGPILTRLLAYQVSVRSIEGVQTTEFAFLDIEASSAFCLLGGHDTFPWC